MQQIA